MDNKQLPWHAGTQPDYAPGDYVKVAVSTEDCVAEVIHVMQDADGKFYYEVWIAWGGSRVGQSHFTNRTCTILCKI